MTFVEMTCSFFLVFLLVLVVHQYLKRYCLVKFWHENYDAFIGAASQNIGLLYGILLAFMVVVGWENYSSTQAGILAEVTNTQLICRDAEAFGAKEQRQILKTATAYLNSVVYIEWPLMQKEMPVINNPAYERLWKVYSTIQPVSQKEAAFLSISLEHLNALGEARKHRIASAYTFIPMGLWILMYIGAVLSSMIILFFEGVPLSLRYFIIIMECILIFFSLTVIHAFDHPYGDFMSLSPAIYADTAKMIQSTASVQEALL
jgi:hypothetical protein